MRSLHLTMLRKTIIITALSGASAVVLGAMGAHAVKNLISADDLAVYNKAVLYQFLHAPMILMLGLLSKIQFHKTLQYAVRCFVLGTILFSGSLYLLAFRNTIDLGGLVNILGPITPIGGLLFIAGWISLLVYGLKHSKNVGTI